MKLKKILGKNKLSIFVIISYFVVLFYDYNLFKEALLNTGLYLKEMLEIMPAVVMISALISVWVPREVIMNNFGDESGLKGKLISVFIGSISAGPIYAAFPLTQSLLFKGASISNVVIIISSWAVIKIPMLIVESRFLGLSFATARYLLTLPVILIIGFIMDRVLRREDVLAEVTIDGKELEAKIKEILPGFDCGACDFNSCSDYAQAIVQDNVATDRCIADEDISKEIDMIIKGC